MQDLVPMIFLLSLLGGFYSGMVMMCGGLGEFLNDYRHANSNHWNQQHKKWTPESQKEEEEFNAKTFCIAGAVFTLSLITGLTIIIVTLLFQ